MTIIEILLAFGLCHFIRELGRFRKREWLTTWVDFTRVASAAANAGFEIAGYSAQAQFLMAGGLDAEMRDFAALPLEAQLELSQQIKTLTLPGEMGEHFKCMALRKGTCRTPSAFTLADRTHTL